LELRWDASAAPLLRSALGEVPRDAQVWLANKLGVTLDAESHAYALQSDWEEYAARAARRLLEAGQPDQALRILRERSERLPDSPLRALEATALYGLDQPDAAIDKAGEGIRAATASGDVPGQVELELLLALMFENRDRLEEAFQSATVAADAAGPAGLLEAELRARLRLLRLSRKTDRGWRGLEDRARALGLLEALGMERVEADAGLLRDAAAELGDDSLPYCLPR
jgi:hypothetical protein